MDVRNVAVDAAAAPGWYGAMTLEGSALPVRLICIIYRRQRDMRRRARCPRQLPGRCHVGRSPRLIMSVFLRRAVRCRAVRHRDCMR